MRVASLAVHPLTSLPAVILVDDSGEVSVQMSVGLTEASAIAAELENIELERPTAHHLLLTLIRRLGASVEYVEICEFDGNAFHAAVHLLCADGSRVIERARPSDAIVLSLSDEVDIWLCTDVLESLREPAVTPVYPQVAYAADELADYGDVCESSVPSDPLGKWKM